MEIMSIIALSLTGLIAYMLFLFGKSLGLAIKLTTTRIKKSLCLFQMKAALYILKGLSITPLLIAGTAMLSMSAAIAIAILCSLLIGSTAFILSNRMIEMAESTDGTKAHQIIDELLRDRSFNIAIA